VNFLYFTRLGPVPDDRMDPRRRALFAARSVLSEVRDGRRGGRFIFTSGRRRRRRARGDPGQPGAGMDGGGPLRHLRADGVEVAEPRPYRGSQPQAAPVADGADARAGGCGGVSAQDPSAAAGRSARSAARVPQSGRVALRARWAEAWGVVMSCRLRFFQRGQASAQGRKARRTGARRPSVLPPPFRGGCHGLPPTGTAQA